MSGKYDGVWDTQEHRPNAPLIECMEFGRLSGTYEIAQAWAWERPTEWMLWFQWICGVQLITTLHEEGLVGGGPMTELI